MGWGMWLNAIGELGCWIIGWSESYNSVVYFVIVWIVCTRAWWCLYAMCGVLIVPSLW